MTRSHTCVIEIGFATDPIPPLWLFKADAHIEPGKEKQGAVDGKGRHAMAGLLEGLGDK